MSATDEIKARLDIVDVVAETVTLKKTGRNYIGFCPFHSNTKTPAFVVFPETQTWRCFGACADGGDLFSFVMKREGYDFKEALRLLAQKAGVQLEEPTPETAQQDEQRHKLLELQAAAATYFHNLLTTSPAGAETRAYLAERELTPETIATFQLGYALDEWEALKNHFLERGYSPDDLLAAGLIVERDDGSPGYDRFRHRLIIPIRDLRGRVIGFGARALAEDQVPKYLNSPQTALFDKSATLYGLDLARKSIRESGQVVIVEGYMDVIQAHQRGGANVVAQMGTALTELQLQRIAKLANKIVLALDSDTAGNAATIRSLSLARQLLPKTTRAMPTSRGIELEAHLIQEIYIAPLPEGKDPDDVLKEGLDVWQQLIDHAKPTLDFYEDLILSQADLATPQGKSFAVRELIPIYREIKDSIEREARVQRLARKIGLDERTLMAELKSKEYQPRPVRQKHRAAVSGSPPPPPEPDLLLPGESSSSPKAAARPDATLERHCLALIITNPAALAVANDRLEKEGVPGLNINDFKQGDNREIFRWLNIWTAAETPKLENLMEMVGELLNGQLAGLASQWHRRPAPPAEDVSRDLSGAILRLRLQSIADQINELTSLQHNTFDSQDNRYYTERVEQYRQERKKLEYTQDALSLIGRRRQEANQFSEPILGKT
ncbi:MAG: DNA primase [Anaerolineae bacterium]|nr:DNA primase [Anaerolineae bacterium]